MADKYEIRNCGRCSNGQTPWGACFKCGGSGKIRFNLSAEKRRKTTEENQAKRYATNAAELGKGDLAFLQDKISMHNTFLNDLRDKYCTYGKLSEKQFDAAKRVYAKQKDYLEKKAVREKEWAERDAKSNFVGEPKKRMEFVVTLEFTKSFDTQFGTSTLHKFRDDDGNIFTWFASSYSEVTEKKGEKIRIKGTVKKHETYRGAKQTVINRVKYLGSVEEKEAENFVKYLEAV